MLKSAQTNIVSTFQWIPKYQKLFAHSTFIRND